MRNRGGKHSSSHQPSRGHRAAAQRVEGQAGRRSGEGMQGRGLDKWRTGGGVQSQREREREREAGALEQLPTLPSRERERDLGRRAGCWMPVEIESRGQRHKASSSD